MSEAKTGKDTRSSKGTKISMQLGESMLSASARTIGTTRRYSLDRVIGHMSRLSETIRPALPPKDQTADIGKDPGNNSSRH